MGSSRFAAALAIGISVSTYAVEIRPTHTVSGVRLRVAVTNAATHAPVRRFTLLDDKPLHLFVAGGAGLRVFRHVVPDEQPDAAFSADVDLPETGLYMAFAEFVPAGAWPQLAQQAFTTGSGLSARAGELADEPHTSNGIRASVDLSETKSGSVSRLVFDVADEASGAPISDLEASPGAAARLFAVSSDLTEAQDLLAQDHGTGPRVAFAPLFPRKGRYKMWLQVRRASHPAVIPFVIDVP